MNLPIDEVKDPGIHSLPKALSGALGIMLSTCGTQSRTQLWLQVCLFLHLITLVLLCLKLVTGTCSSSSGVFLGNCPFLLSVWNDLLNYPVLLKLASSSITVVTVNMVHGCSAFSFLVIFKFLYSKIHNFVLTVGSCAKIIDPWFLIWRFVLFTLRVFWVRPLQHMSAGRLFSFI